MFDADPYHVQAGCELDQLIHSCVMGQTSGTPPAYSSDQQASRSVLAALKEITGAKVLVGRTYLRDRRWFARYETDPSDGTEVFADTAALAICRLALLHAAKTESRKVPRTWRLVRPEANRG
jgi:hypothetical protein